MFVGSDVFNVSGKFGKYVISCCVGLTVLRCKSGVPKRRSVNTFEARLSLSCLFPNLFPNWPHRHSNKKLIFLPYCDCFYGLLFVQQFAIFIIIVSTTTTLGGLASPPGTLLSCWHQWEPPPGRWGMEGESPGPGCEDQLVSYRNHILKKNLSSHLIRLLLIFNRYKKPASATCGNMTFYLLRSTVVTLKTTPLSQRIMKRRWENGQFPMLSPSLPACEHKPWQRSFRWAVMSSSTSFVHMTVNQLRNGREALPPTSHTLKMIICSHKTC